MRRESAESEIQPGGKRRTGDDAAAAPGSARRTRGKLNATGRNATGAFALVVGAGAIFLTIALFAYRSEVTRSEIRVRRFPFLTRTVAMKDVTHLVQKRTLTLVTPTSRIPLWGLDASETERLFQILPQRLQVLGDLPVRRSERSAHIRRHRKAAIITGAGFIATAALSVPFFRGNSLDRYWSSVGQQVVTVCLAFFIAFVIEAGFTWVLSSSARDLDRADHSGRRSR
jgi:hypothetical protein